MIRLDALLLVGSLSLAACGGADDQLTRVDVPPGDKDTIRQFVGGSSASDLWLHQKPGTLLHWDGSKFASVAVPGLLSYSTVTVEPGPAGAVWVTVWSGSSAQLLLVGGDGSVQDFSSEVVGVGSTPRIEASTSAAWVFGPIGSTVVFHLLNGHFQAVSVPSDLTGITRVFAEDDVWAARSNGLYHWDGATWTATPLPVDGYSTALVDPARFVRFGPKAEWQVGDGYSPWKLVHWQGTSLAISDVTPTEPKDPAQLKYRQVIPFAVSLGGGKLGVLIQRTTALDVASYSTEVVMNVVDGTTAGADVHVYQLDRDCYPTCTAAQWGAALDDGNIVLLMAGEHSPSIGFGGPAAFLIGKPSD